MVPFIFRSDRIELDLTINVGLQDILTKEQLPEFITTTIINFSREGACLVVSKPSIDGKHLFFDTLNNNRYNLLLLSTGNEDGLYFKDTIAARSIWMDSCLYRDKPSFKIGIRFLHKQNLLYKNLKKRFSS